MANPAVAQQLAPLADLSPTVSEQIITAIRLGATVEIAAGSVGVTTADYYDWTARGRSDIDAGRDTLLARFVEACRTERHAGDIELLASIRRRCTGTACLACKGRGISPADQAGGRAGKKHLIRCPGCRGTGWATQPDGRLALELLGRRHSMAYGRKDRHHHEVTGEGGGPVRVNVRAVAATMTADLGALTGPELVKIAYGEGASGAASVVELPTARALLPRRDVIDAVEAAAIDGAPVVDATVEAVAVDGGPRGPAVFEGLAEAAAAT